VPHAAASGQARAELYGLGYKEPLKINEKISNITKDDVLKFILSSIDEQISPAAREEFIIEHIYNGQKLGKVCQYIRGKIEGKENKLLISK